MTKYQILRELENNNIEGVIDALKMELNKSKSRVNQTKLISLIKYCKRMSGYNTVLGALIYLNIGGKKYCITPSFIVMTSDSAIGKLDVKDMEECINDAENDYRKQDLLKLKESFLSTIEEAEYNSADEIHRDNLYEEVLNTVDSYNKKYKGNTLYSKLSANKKYYQHEICDGRYYNGKVLKLILETYPVEHICIKDISKGKEDAPAFAPALFYNENKELIAFILPLGRGC